MKNENIDMAGVRLELASKVLKEIQSMRVSLEVTNTISMDENIESAREGLGGPPKYSEIIPLTCLEKLVYIISRKI